MMRRLPRGTGSAPTPLLPVNTVLPLATSATIGAPMQLLTTGSWTNSPTTIVVQNWLSNGAPMGASWTPTEAERGQTIEADVVATNAQGSTTVRITCGVVRRTELAVAYNFGQLTPTGTSGNPWGSVQIKNLSVLLGSYLRTLLGPGVTAPTSWTLDSGAGDGGVLSGTGAHWGWGAAGKTPYRVAAIAGTYSFRLLATFSDGVTETQMLTITAKAGVITFGDGATGAWASTLTVGNTVDDNAVELAVGVAPGTNFFFNSIRLNADPALCKRIIIRNADPLRPALADRISCAGSYKLRFEGLQTRNYATDGQHFNITVDGSTGEPSKSIELYDYTHGDGTPNTRDGTNTGLQLFGVDGFTAARIRISGVRQGLVHSWGINAVIDGLTIDTFDDNGAQVGGDTAGKGFAVNGLTINDLLIRGATRKDGAHLDGFQVADIANGGYIHINRVINSRAGGIAGPQGVFAGAAGATGAQVAPIDFSITGLLGDNRGIAGLANVRGDNSNWKYISYIRHNGNDVPSPDTHHDGPNDPTHANGPWIQVGWSDPAFSNGVNTLDYAIIWTDVRSLGGWTVGSNVVQFGKNNAPLDPAQAAMFKNGDPGIFMDAIPDATWRAMTDAELSANIKAAHWPNAATALAAASPIDPATGDWRAEVLAA
jgi:hypothetical protein